MGLVDIIKRFFEKDLVSTVKAERCKQAYCNEEQYYISINDGSITNPFLVSREMMSVANRFSRLCSDYEKAKAIFDWMLDNIKYKESGGLKNAIEVFEKGYGICSEESVLYITLARCCGIKAKYVSVKIDDEGKKVCHACAAVYINGKWLLVDPAYQTFDIAHRVYTLVSDKEVAERFSDE